MYGYANDHATDNNLVRNEISFTNLIAIANNKMLFDALDPETKQQLVKIYFLCNHYRDCSSFMQMFLHER